MAAGTKSLAVVMPGPSSNDRQGAPCELREVTLPELETDSALLRVELSEVCGTDVYLRDGLLADVPYPIIPGHVSVGVLDKIRGTLTDVYGQPLEEGERVTFLDVHRSCHECWYCQVAKASTRCPHRKVYGITYGLEDGLTGGWAEHIYLKPGVQCLRLEGVDSELYMAGGCSLPTALHAVQRADVNFADTVLILGSGPVGLSAVAFSSLRGARRVICFGAPTARLEVAGAMGATDTLDIQNHSVEARGDFIRELTQGRGADVTIECTGSPAAVVQAMQWTRDCGNVVIVGQYTDHGDVTFNPHEHLNKKHLDVRGCWGSDFSHFHRAIEVLRTPAAAKWSAIALTRYSLSRADEALNAVAAGEVIKALIVPKS